MSSGMLILRSLRHYWRTNLAVALGAAVGCAVLGGALLVGTSIRGSLRDLSLERLGRIDYALVSNRFFSAGLADALAASSQLAVPAILHSGSVTHESSGRRAGNISVVGIPSGAGPHASGPDHNRAGATSPATQATEVKSGPGENNAAQQSRGREGAGLNDGDRSSPFWRLSDEPPPPIPEDRRVVVNQTLAADLGAKRGDTILLRLPAYSAIPSESLLGRRDRTVRTLRAEIAAVIPERGLGRFTLQATQQTPRNVYVDLERVQRTLDLPGQINTVLIAAAGTEARSTASDGARSTGSDGAGSTGSDGAGSTASDGAGATGSHGAGDTASDRVRSTGAADSLRKAIADAATAPDLGLRMLRHTIETTARGEFEYASIESTQMVLPMQVEQAAMQAAEDAGLIASPVLTYLANTIRPHGGGADAPLAPYSVVAAIDLPPPAPFPPMMDVATAVPTSHPGSTTQAATTAVSTGIATTATANAGQTAAPPIIFNEWLASRLNARIGRRFDLTYYMLNPGGELRTETRTFRLDRIVALAGPAADPGLTPEYPGISQARTMADWDPPFPVDYNLVGDADEQYWEEQRATPKAFIPLAVGQQLWASDGESAARFGRLTSIRLAAPQGEPLTPRLTHFTMRLRELLDPAAAGLILRPVKRESLEASTGATDFGGLFIGFSMFLIASAALLVVLLFRLAVEQRARQIGLLRAVGLPLSRIRRLLAAEGFVLAALGGAIGAAAAVGYAWLMIAGLRTLWRSAVGTSRLSLHISAVDLAIGTSIGILLAALSVLWAVRIAGKRPIVAMLAGAVSGEMEPEGRAGERHRAADGSRGTMRRRLAAAAAVLALATLTGSWFVSGAARAGLFFGGGALLLAAALTGLSAWIASGPGGAVSPGRYAMIRLAIRNAARRSDRSTLTVSLVACATFTVVAVAASRHEPEFRPGDRRSGHGGFALFARSDVPILTDLNRAIGAGELTSDASQESLAGVRVFPLRSRPGDDASCLNLYKPQQPSLLGVTEALIERGGFAFGSTLADDPETRANPWRLLQRDLGEGVVPVFADANTATWLLKLGLGDELTIRDGRGRPLRLRLVGTLSRSIFQSELILSERHFLKCFPLTSGYGAFLIDVPTDASSGSPAQAGASRIDRVAAALESALADYGFDAVRTQQRLAAYMAVENTYLSTFQMLGGLGLLLGTFGIAAVLLRNVMERRGELALLSAVGFRRGLIRRLVVLETGALVALGLLIGAAAALIAVAPNAAQSPGHVPWLSLAATLAIILVIGVTTAAIAARASTRGDLITALRGG